MSGPDTRIASDGAAWLLLGYDMGAHACRTLTGTFADGYDAGYTDGVRDGREQLHHEIGGAQRAAVARAIAGVEARQAGAYVPGVAS